MASRGDEDFWTRMKTEVKHYLPVIIIIIAFVIFILLPWLILGLAKISTSRISGSVINYEPSGYPMEVDMTVNVEDPNWKNFSKSPIFESCENCSISNTSYVSKSLQSIMKIESAGDYTLLINNENGYFTEAQFNFTSKDENTVNDVNKRNILMCSVTVKQNEIRTNEEQNREIEKNNLLIECFELNNAYNFYKLMRDWIYIPECWCIYLLIITIIIGACYWIYVIITSRRNFWCFRFDPEGPPRDQYRPANNDSQSDERNQP